MTCDLCFVPTGLCEVIFQVNAFFHRMISPRAPPDLGIQAIYTISWVAALFIVLFPFFFWSVKIFQFLLCPVDNSSSIPFDSLHYVPSIQFGSCHLSYLSKVFFDDLFLQVIMEQFVCLPGIFNPHHFSVH